MALYTPYSIYLIFRGDYMYVYTHLQTSGFLFIGLLIHTCRVTKGAQDVRKVPALYEGTERAQA